MNARERQILAAAAMTLKLHGHVELARQVNEVAGMPADDDD